MASSVEDEATFWGKRSFFGKWAGLGGELKMDTSHTRAQKRELKLMVQGLGAR